MPSLISMSARTWKSSMRASATAGELPRRTRGRVCVRATERNLDSVAGMVAEVRFIHPSPVDFTPGVPLSMKSWQSKCERDVSGEPTACTMPRRPSR
jgi:hypothetical protein